MEFTPPRHRGRIDSIVPMINIVFLLLIFFLMTATIAPPEPLDLTPPDSAATDAAEHGDTVFVGADGRMLFAGASGPAVFEAIAARAADAPPLLIRADRGVPASRIAGILAELGARGIGSVQLLVGRS